MPDLFVVEEAMTDPKIIGSLVVAPKFVPAPSVLRSENLGREIAPVSVPDPETGLLVMVKTEGRESPTEVTVPATQAEPVLESAPFVSI